MASAGPLRTRERAQGLSARAIAGALLGAALLVACLLAAATVNGYYVFVLANVALLAIVGVGLNVLIGLTGQVSFGHVGFYAIGAYAVAILTTRAGLPFGVAWLAGTLLAGVMGVLVAQPALRVRGPYLAMVTIAFGLIVEHAAVEMRGLTGGQNGIMNLPRPALPGMDGSERSVAMLAIVAAGVVVALFAVLSRGTWGAAMRAGRDSETAAASIGIDVVRVKTVAFAVSAALAGLAGGLFAPLSGFVTPSSFGFLQSILFVLVVMIGGAGTVAGPVAGAFVVGLLPEALSALEEYRLLFFGTLLLVVLWVAPNGIVGVVQAIARRVRAVPPPPPVDTTAGTARIAHAVQGRARALAAHDLALAFGGVRAVDGLSLRVEPGTIVGLIGPNGAGKTTALNILAGFYRSSAGSVRLGDETLTHGASFRIARAGVARTYQTTQLFGSLDVIDNVALGALHGRLGGPLAAARLRSPQVRAHAASLLRFCGFRGDTHVRAADLPHVDRRLAEIARALAGAPSILLLDEPAAGLAREDKAHLATLLRAIAREGVGVVLVEHDMALVMEVCDAITVLDAGKAIAQGAPAAIRADPAVRRAYLGEAGENDALPPSARPPSTSPELLGVARLSAGYGAAPVLNDVTLALRRGEVVALLGANGAGKSTLMRVLAGLHRPVQGALNFDGRDLVSAGSRATVAHGLILVPEGRQVFPELSVRDNLKLGGFRRGGVSLDADVEAMLVRFPRLRERIGQRAGLLSGGEQQMLAVARGLMARPTLLLLDEPSLGLAPKIIAELFAALDSLRQEGMSLLLVDQMAALALAVADRAYVMESGRIVLAGSAAEVARDPALAQAYLGKAGA